MSLSFHYGVSLGSRWGLFGITVEALLCHFDIAFEATLGSLWDHFGNITQTRAWPSWPASFARMTLVARTLGHRGPNALNARLAIVARTCHMQCNATGLQRVHDITMP